MGSRHRRLEPRMPGIRLSSCPPMMRLANNLFPRMYKSVTGHWPFTLNPRTIYIAMLSISHEWPDELVKTTTIPHRSDIRFEKSDVISEGKEMHSDAFSVYLSLPSPGVLKRSCGGAEPAPIKSALNEPILYRNFPDDVATFARIVGRSWLSILPSDPG